MTITTHSAAQAGGNAPAPGGTHSTVLVTSRSFAGGTRDLVAELAAAGLDVVRGATDHAPDALAEPLSEAVAWIAGTAPVTAAHLDAAPHLRVIARYGVGVDAVDLEAAAARGIVVTNTPGANSGAVADHAIALMLASLRGLARADRAVRGGDWQAWRTRELSSLTIGLVGFGRIGQATAARLSGFGSTVLAADPWMDLDLARARGVILATVDALPAYCDIVSLHAPGGLVIVDGPWLARTRSPFILVNTARADLVDEPALVAALRTDHNLHYAADALVHEHGSGGPSALLSPDLADQVVVTPHLAANTVEAVDLMGAMAVGNVLAVLDGRAPPNPVPPRRS